LQILSALEFGRVISIDIEKTIHGGKQPVGKYILPKYPYEQLITDATAWIAMTGEKADLIFEDTSHSQETTYKIYKHAERVLTAGGIIISHDAVHPKFRGAVVAGITQAGIEPNVYLVEGDGCGFAIWQKPKKEINFDTIVEKYVSPPSFESGEQMIGAIENIVAESSSKPKRKRRKSKKKTAIEDV